jgi:hypothetical protein
VVEGAKGPAGNSRESSLMLLLAVLGVCIVVALLTGGRFSAFTEIELRRVWLVAAALILQVLITSISLAPANGLYAPAHVISYLLAAAFVLSNARLPGVWLIGVGGALNFVAILANGGVMPASPGAVEAAGLVEAGKSFANSGVVPNARLAFLGDVFAVPDSIPFSNVFSIGDLCIAAGAGIAVFGICYRRPPADARVVPAELEPSRPPRGELSN